MDKPEGLIRRRIGLVTGPTANAAGITYKRAQLPVLGQYHKVECGYLHRKTRRMSPRFARESDAWSIQRHLESMLGVVIPKENKRGLLSEIDVRMPSYSFP